MVDDGLDLLCRLTPCFAISVERRDCWFGLVGVEAQDENAGGGGGGGDDVNGESKDADLLDDNDDKIKSDGGDARVEETLSVICNKGDNGMALDADVR